MKRIFAHIGFSFAVALIVLNLLEVKYVFPVTAGLAVVFAASLVLPVFRQGKAVPICVGSALIACLIFICFYTGSVAPQLAMSNKQVNVDFYLVDVEDYDGDSYVYTAKTTCIEANDAPQKIKLKVKTSEPLDVDGYHIVHSKMNLHSIGETAFSSYGYWGKGIYLTARLKHYTVTDEYVKSPWRYVLQLRGNIIDTLSSNVGGDSGGLAAALVTGNKSGLRDVIVDNFKCAGASHLMAVSGFHLTVLIGMLVFILKGFRVNDKVISIASALSIFVIIGLAGFSKSVIRAGIMMLVMLLARLVSRRADGVNSLGIAVFLMCLNPFAVTDIGAQLSVLSVLSLLTLEPHFVNKFKRDSDLFTDGFISVLHTKRRTDGIFIGFTTALSIMIYTMPVMYLFFGYISIAGLLSNIILVPFGSLCIVTSFITYLCLRLHFLTFVFTKICGYSNAVLLYIVHRFAAIKNSVLPFSEYFGYVLAIIAVAFGVCFIMNNRKLMKKVGVLSAIVVVLLFTVAAVMSVGSANVLVCEGGAVAVQFDNKAVVYNVSNRGDYYSVRKFLISSNKKIDTIIQPEHNKYALRLADSFGCENYVTSQINEDVLNCNGIKCVEYCYDFNRDGKIIIRYNKNSHMPYCLFTVNGVTIAVGDEILADSDILISNNYAEDSYGLINLKNNDVIYSISNNGVYKARRVDIWQE